MQLKQKRSVLWAGLKRSPVISQKKAFSLGSISSTLLFLISIILSAVMLLMLVGFTKGGVAAAMPNMEEITTNYMIDAILGLSDWDGECGCLAKGVTTALPGPEKHLVYPGLVPKEKLDSMQDKCFNSVRKGRVVMLKNTLIGYNLDPPSTYAIDEINSVALTAPITAMAIPVPSTTLPVPETKPKQYITYQHAGSGGYALLVTSEPTEKAYLKNGNTLHTAGGWDKEVDYVISPPVCIASIGSTETYHEPYWKPWKMEITDAENGKKWDFGVKDCPLLRYCTTKEVSEVPKVVCDPSLSYPDLVVYKPEWGAHEERIIAIDYGSVVHIGKAKFQLGACTIDEAYQVPA